MELILEKAITAVRQSESVKKQQSTLCQDEPVVTTEASIDAIGKYSAQRSWKAGNKSIPNITEEAFPAVTKLLLH